MCCGPVARGRRRAARPRVCPEVDILKALLMRRRRPATCAKPAGAKTKVLRIEVRQHGAPNVRSVMEPQPRFLTPGAAVLGMLAGAEGRVSAEIGARRSFLRAAAAERGPRTAVPPGLRGAYVSWVRSTIAARHGRASDVHLGLHAFVMAHSLGLPSTRAALSKRRPASPGSGQAKRRTNQAAEAE